MQELSATLKEALSKPAMTVKPWVRIEISNNSNYSPTVEAPSGRNKKGFANGWSTSCIKLAIVDSETMLDAGYRPYPKAADFVPQTPYVSDSVSDVYGDFDGELVFEVVYGQEVKTNKILISSHKFGQNSAGLISNADVYLKLGSSTSYTLVSSGISSSSYMTSLYLQSNNSWSTAINRTNTTTINAIKVVVKSIKTNEFIALENRRRPFILQEIDSMLDLDISSDVISCETTKQRDVSDTTLSVLGTSTSNTMSISLDNTSNKYSNRASNIFSGLLNQEVKFEVKTGILTTSGYEYINQGTFYADEWSISADSATASVSCRDYSKWLQILKMYPTVYENKRIDEVIKDVIEYAGVENYKIDKSLLKKEDLATGYSLEYSDVNTQTETRKNNFIWSDVEETCWEFLNKVAASDLGTFWFNEDGTFIYKCKEALIDTNREDSYPVKTIKDSDYIIDCNLKTELIKNDIQLNYVIPKISKNKQLWEASDDISLSSTGLYQAINSSANSIKAGNIETWNKSGYFRIDDEIIKYDSRTDDTFLECTRGQFGTTPASHTIPSPTHTSTIWPSSAGTWVERGGFLETDAGGSYKYIRLDQKFARDNGYIWSGKFKITASPWECSIIFMANSTFTNFYRLKIRTTNPSDTNKGVKTGPYAVLERVVGATTTTLSQYKTASVAITGILNSFEVQVTKNGIVNRISCYVNGTKVVDKFDDSYDVQIDDTVTEGAYVGFGATSNGKTYFDDAKVVNLSGTSGRNVAFFDTFGEPVYEIKEIEAEHISGDDSGPALNSSPNFFLGGGKSNSNPYVRTVDFESTPYKTNIIVENLQNELIYISSRNKDIMNSVFFITGDKLSLQTKDKLSKEDKVSQKRYGKNSLNVTTTWVQSKEHAQSILDYLISVYTTPIEFLSLNIFAIPELQLGDVLLVNYGRMGIVNEKYHVQNIKISQSSSGLAQDITLRRLVDQSTAQKVRNIGRYYKLGEPAVGISEKVAGESEYSREKLDVVPVIIR